ncbi:MAG: tripartite tricarboxylate transporter TctB family protein [Beijerinckiaceae bacterium]|nr:tripartite tricarboxylate transporter TctB family protein [Beijerinckiaceae bacterium]
MTDHKAGDPGSSSRRGIPEDVGAGVFLILIALFFIWQAWSLPLGSLRAMGPGMLPMSIAVIMGSGGVLLAILALVKGGSTLTMPHVRGLFFVLGGLILFGFTVRWLGLIIAGPVSMIFASFATEEVRPVEAIIFAIAMTAFCIGLFKFALGLPIPIIAFM